MNKMKKKYELSKSMYFPWWANEKLKQGYHPFISQEKLQHLIDYIAFWYEIKYPNQEMHFDNDAKNYNNLLAQAMTMEELLKRLSHDQLFLIQNNYRGNGGYIKSIQDNNGNVIGKQRVMGIVINKREFVPYSLDSTTPYFFVYAIPETGKIERNSQLDEYTNNHNLTLESLLDLLQTTYHDQLDLTELEQCIYDHQCDGELRNNILQLVALKLLYSPQTTPEKGYKRATMFLNEWNQAMNLDLSSEEIDNIMNRNYKDESFYHPRKKKKNKLFTKIKKLNH